MFPGAFCARNISEVAKAPNGCGVLLTPQNFAEFDSLTGADSEFLHSALSSQGVYRGFSSLYHCWTDTHEVKAEKDKRLELAVKIHRSLDDNPEAETPFRFLTEPYGDGGRVFRDDRFGLWDGGPEFCERVAKFFLSRGITHISISQNRLRDERVWVETLNLIQRIQGNGLDCSVGIQVWFGLKSLETAHLAVEIIKGCEDLGIGAFVAEIGARYSPLIDDTPLGIALAKAEHGFVGERLTSLHLRYLNDNGVNWTFWNGSPSEAPKARGLMHLSGFDFLDTPSGVAHTLLTDGRGTVSGE